MTLEEKRARNAEYSRRWRARHKELKRERDREYRLAHKSLYAAANRRWRWRRDRLKRVKRLPIVRLFKNWKPA